MGRGRGGEHGQATVEWPAAVLFVACALGALATFGRHVDGRSLGGFLAQRIVCAVKGDCARRDAALARAYGTRDAALVREHAPGLVYERGERQLPVDYRRCRSVRCARAPDDPDLDVHRSDSGQRATAFTRVVRRSGRTYILYWFYYPDSNSSWMGSSDAWRALRATSPPFRLANRALRGSEDYPGFHPDDWEAYAVRLDRDGSVWARSSAHGHWQGCLAPSCRGEWIGGTGWTRVSRGSHAGHVPVGARLDPPAAGRWPGRQQHDHSWVPHYPGVHLDERSSTAEGMRLVPLEELPRNSYRPLAGGGIGPPWDKEAYDDPESQGS